MRFTVGRSGFVEALQKIQSVVERKNTVQVLSHVLLVCDQNVLTMTATDLEVGLRVQIPVDTQVSGKLAISARSLHEIIRELPEKPITLTKIENNWIEISCQKSIFKIVGLSAEEFPPLPVFESNSYMQVSAATMREMIDLTLFAVSTDETRHQMNGVYFKEMSPGILRMAATDGNRLTFVDRELLLDGSNRFTTGVIIPRKGLSELRKLIDSKHFETFSMALDGSNLLVKLEGALLFVRLIEGQFPDYEQVVPTENDKELVLNRQEFISSLKRVSLLSNDLVRNVRFFISNNTLTMTSSNPDLGDAKEELDCEYTADPVEIAFNAKYILECLNLLSSEKISIDLKDTLSSGVVRPYQQRNYTYIVMPMRI